MSVAGRSIVLLIRSLNVGGAERQMVLLASGLHQRGYDVRVVMFYKGGALAAELERAGVRVVSLDKGGRWDIVPFFLRLQREVRAVRPDVLYSFMPGANVVAALLRPLLPGVRIVWGVRASDVDLVRYDWLARSASRLESLLSRIPAAVVANSHAGLAHAIAKGFPAGRISVIPNGIDVTAYSRDAVGRQAVRAELGVAESEVLIGVVARLDPMKGHATFLRAAAAMAPQAPQVRFVCVGDGPAPIRHELQALTTELDLGDRVRWPGSRADMRAVYSALDIACSASLYGEGFSNAIAEAMACANPCVAANVGDAARVLGDTGVVVPVGEPHALAAGLRTFVDQSPAEREGWGRRARDRVVEMFSVDAMVDATVRVLFPVRGGA
jgi:glycosyltransferase involved in cell wall biosynthesis